MLNYGTIFTVFIKGVSLMGIEHLGIVSKDTLRLKNWYQEIFGGDVVYDNGKGTYFLAFEDKSMIEFVMATDDKPEDVEKSAGIRHIAMAVSSEEFDRIVPILKADDRIEEVHDVSENAKGLKTYWFRDIDGNFAHLIYRPQPLV